MKKLFAGYTQYQLLIFLLLKQPDDKIIFLLPKYLENLKKILETKYRVEIIEREKPPLKKIFQYLKYYSYIKKLIKKINISEDTILYGDSIINYAISNKNILYKLEDGLGNYNHKLFFEDIKTIKQKLYFFVDSIIYFIFFKKRLLLEREKISKRINGYYATEIAPKDFWYENITKRISLKEIWIKKSLEEQEEILNIFDIKKETLKIISDGDILLFTQTLSEDGIISEDEKIEIYTKILEKYPKDKVVIKVHPREKTNYKKIFPEYRVIVEKFPAEFILLLGIKLERVVTVYSSAVLIFKDMIPIDFYGTEISENILKKVGSCDNIYLKNKKI